MSSDLNTSSSDFFERMYQRDTDPWNFANDPYESSRYDTLIDALSNKHFARAFEPGCSVGVLTARLAPLCDQLIAMDLSGTAVNLARQRCKAYPNVQINVGSVAEFDPDPLDLLLLSEIGYYFNPSDLRAWASRLFSNLRPDGMILTSHWLGVSPDHLLSGDQVQDLLQDLAKEHHFTLTLARRTDKYRLESWKR